MYQLYYTLNKNCDQKYTTQKRNSLVKKLSAITQENKKEALTLLIIQHYLEKGGKINFKDPKYSLPYEGKYTKTNVEFNFDLFPDELLCILEKFIGIN